MFFRKKEKEDEFYKEVRKRNWKGVVKVGRKRFEESGSKTPLDVIVTTASSYVLLKRKDLAVSFLLEAAREKAAKNLFDDSEFLLKKALEIKKDSQVIEELINLYLKVGNKEKIVEILDELLTQLEEKGDEKLLNIIEENVTRVNDERLYARIAVYYEKKSKERAYLYWIRTAEAFERKGMDEYAFRALLRAKRVKDTEEIKRRIVDYIAVKSGKFPVKVLIQILVETKDPYFWIWVFEEFRSKGKMEIFKGIIDNEEIDTVLKLFFSVLLLADLKGVYPSDILEEIEKLDRKIYTILIEYLEEKYGTTLLRTIFGNMKVSIDDIVNFSPEEKRNSFPDKEEPLIDEKIEVNIDELFS